MPSAALCGMPGGQKLHGLCDPGQEGAPVPGSISYEPQAGTTKPFTAAGGAINAASSQIWQPITRAEPCTAMSRSTLY